MGVKLQQRLHQAGFSGPAGSCNDEEITGIVHGHGELLRMAKVSLFYVLHLKLGIKSKILIHKEIAPPGRSLTPRFTPQKFWAGMTRHEVINSSTQFESLSYQSIFRSAAPPESDGGGPRDEAPDLTV